MIDSHAHLDFVDDLDSVLDRAKKAGISKIVTIGTSIECSKNCIEIAEKYSNPDLQIYATCGIHPYDGKGDIKEYGSIEKVIEELSKVVKSSTKVVGIGECGLDYFTVKSEKGEVTGEREKMFQREMFSAQIKLASELDLPLVVHCRNGWEEVFEIIKASKATGLHPEQGPTLKNLTGVFHSWTGDLVAVQKAIDLGFYISFSGILTFDNAPLVKDVAGKIKANRILVETDSPFLAPVPLRGQKNEPKNVKIIASFLSEIRKTNLAAISEETSKNAQKLFNL